MKASSLFKFYSTTNLIKKLYELNRYYLGSNRIALNSANNVAKLTINLVNNVDIEDNYENANTFYFITKSSAMSFKFDITNFKDCIQKLANTELLAIAQIKVNEYDKFKYTLIINQ